MLDLQTRLEHFLAIAKAMEGDEAKEQQTFHVKTNNVDEASAEIRSIWIYQIQGKSIRLDRLVGVAIGLDLAVFSSIESNEAHEQVITIRVF